MYGPISSLFDRLPPDDPRDFSGFLKWTYVVTIVAAADVSIDGTFGTYLPGVDGWVLFEPLPVTVPAFVYLYAFLGAGAYALTSLIFDPKDSTTDVLQLGYRLVAALPLGAGVYLLAAFVLGEPATDGSGAVQEARLLAGTAFVAGLFVRLTLRKLGDVAERLYDIRGDAELPYEDIRRRNEAHRNLQAAYDRLLARDDSLGPARRDELRGRLRQVEAILDDEGATLQEVDRALTLSEEVLEALPGSALRDGPASQVDPA